MFATWPLVCGKTSLYRQKSLPWFIVLLDTGGTNNLKRDNHTESSDSAHKLIRKVFTGGIDQKSGQWFSHGLP